MRKITPACFISDTEYEASTKTHNHGSEQIGVGKGGRGEGGGGKGGGGRGEGGGTTLVKNIKAFTIRSQKEVVEKR